MIQRSTNRILTTHTGSLPRPPELIEMHRTREAGGEVDEATFQAKVKEAVALTVRRQMEVGIDLVSDGEEGKPSYATYIKDRATGFEGELPPPPGVRGEARDFPEFMERRVRTSAASMLRRPACNGPIAWKDFAAVERDIANFKAVVEEAKPVGAFMTTASPGVVALFLPNDYFPSHDAYLEAIAAVLKDEYEAIAAAGFELQLDCPDLAMGRNNQFFDLEHSEFLKIVERHIEVVNEATKNIPPEQMRLHLCWGNYEGPHHLDVALRDIINIVLKSRPAVISFEGANPRHEHEWNIWQDVRLPDDKIVMPGVIDSTTNFIEHPELVAQRIERYAQLVGKERVLAATDCGFGTNAAADQVDPKIVWAKLQALSEGAAIASKRLW